MIGISISLYDKFDDLAVLVDVIRENWEDDYYVTVCSNHADAEARFDELALDVDETFVGDDIEYDPDMTGLREHVNKICRVYDTIRTPCSAAIAADGVDYVMHLHADAWPLSEQRLHDLVEEMQVRETPVAFKGYGLGRRGVFPVGHVMDQYYVLDADYARDVGFFEHSALELLPDRGIHTVMMLLLLGKVGWSNVHFYSDGTEQEFWDGTDVFGVRPMMHNPDWDYLHVATEEFPDPYGKMVQAAYLADRGLTAGEHAGALVEEHAVDMDELRAELGALEDGIDRRLRLYGLSLREDFGRNFERGQAFLDDPLGSRLRYVAGQHLVTASSLLSTVKDRVSAAVGVNETLPAADPVAAAWPERNLDDVYRSELRPADFPDHYAEEFWFQDDE